MTSSEARAGKRAQRWLALSADGRGWRSRRAARRLFGAAARGDASAREAVIAIASDSAHSAHAEALDFVGARLRDQDPDASAALALAWSRTRQPGLRARVIEFGAIADGNPARTQSLALLGRLGTHLQLDDIPHLPALLDDEDADIRENAAAYCLEAEGDPLDALWRASATNPALRTMLLRNPAPPRSHTLDQLWDEWLRSPGDELFRTLRRWGRPAESGDDAPLTLVALGTAPDLPLTPGYRTAVVRALARLEHPLSDIAEKRILALRDQELFDEVCEAALTDEGLAFLCKRHRLAPKDPVKRAAFFLLTGQREQYRAIDPDGSLLSLAYASAVPELRLPLQRAMRSEGQLDLVNVVVGADRRGRLPRLAKEEIRHLAEQLAERAEWTALWTLVQDVSVVTGVELIRLFGQWRPDGKDGRRLFEAYLRREPERLASAAKAMRENGWPRAVRLATVRFGSTRINDMSFAPDGPLLAVAGSGRAAGVIDLAQAGLVERYTGFASSVGSVLHVGGGRVIAAERTNGPDRPCRIVECADGGRSVLAQVNGSVTSLALTDEAGSFAAATRSGHLLTGRPGADEIVRRPVTAFGLDEGDWARAIAAHRPSGRLAVLGRSLVLADPAEGWTARQKARRVAACAAFASADELVCADQFGLVTRLRRDGGRLVKEAELNVNGMGGVCTVPGTGELVAVAQFGHLHFADAESMRERETVRSEVLRTATTVTVAPSGQFLAVGNALGEAVLYDLRVGWLPRLAEEPLAAVEPGHLGAIAAADGVRRKSAQVKDLLKLMRIAMEHRFRFDNELGDAVPLTARDFDISL
ncbi:hypothetical protein [Actinomadura rupiterrae]|uniref:hypothetical protein n=1 Tax=Actinomadura rupiterrae TaxID=559627 RepID=UPI0020A3295B|nr:hypothetical protein [Actinomadura rupiterrae]MCP2341048.1 hypothetical protein [Actinomadura rupiterrae]